MKSVELPDLLFRKAVAAAEARGVPLADFLAEALRQAQASRPGERSRKAWPVPPPETSKAESRRVEARILQGFGRVELETWK